MSSSSSSCSSSSTWTRTTMFSGTLLLPAAVAEAAVAVVAVVSAELAKVPLRRSWTSWAMAGLARWRNTRLWYCTYMSTMASLQLELLDNNTSPAAATAADEDVGLIAACLLLFGALSSSSCCCCCCSMWHSTRLTSVMRAMAPWALRRRSSSGTTSVPRDKLLSLSSWSSSAAVAAAVTMVGSV